MIKNLFVIFKDEPSNLTHNHSQLDSLFELVSARQIKDLEILALAIKQTVH